MGLHHVILEVLKHPRAEEDAGQANLDLFEYLTKVGPAEDLLVEKLADVSAGGISRLYDVI
eukprot:CAMPEP_0118658682 /NCGR_PEP_ID=MMETSP0785-20121206/14703_1 /TAXON_ID=91992 /ORGANISM="Bolidomonas pacifica, Strain CCMP 1866" /LENGTH=60 /DNA_ID=CAMNT_0006551725 /DNA_START=174 /DNA_END=356 /DNA_ORIENTATION=+